MRLKGRSEKTEIAMSEKETTKKEKAGERASVDKKKKRSPHPTSSKHRRAIKEGEEERDNYG